MHFASPCVGTIQTMMTFYEMETIFITLTKARLHECKGIKLIKNQFSQLENQLKPRKLGVHKRSANCLEFAVCISAFAKKNI